MKGELGVGMRSYRRVSRVAVSSAACAAAVWLAACAARDTDGPSVPTGMYELEASMGGQTFPVRLELLSIEGRPWGRLTVVAGQERVVAVRGIEGLNGRWSFAVGGPVRGLQLEFAGGTADSVAGSLELGSAPPIRLAGRRAGEVAAAEELRAHHARDPLGLAARAGEQGASFPTRTPEGALIFARHGPDLSSQTLMIARPAGDGWGDPEVLSLSGRHSDRSPFVLPDGSALVFASDRPTGSDGDFEGYRLWFAPRTGAGEWGGPSPVELEGGWAYDARQPSVTAEGTLYFSSDADGGSGASDVWVAAPVAPGRWAAPRNPGEPINGPDDEHGAFVAPDGSYMVLVSAGDRPGRAGGDDLYLSRRTPDGWTSPTPLELPVNTFANEYGPWVSPDDGHLYFTSDRYGHARLFRTPIADLPIPNPGMGNQ